MLSQRAFQCLEKSSHSDVVLSKKQVSSKESYSSHSSASLYVTTESTLCTYDWLMKEIYGEERKKESNIMKKSQGDLPT